MIACPECRNRNTTYAHHLDGVEYYVCLAADCGCEFPVDMDQYTYNVEGSRGNMTVNPVTGVMTWKDEVVYDPRVQAGQRLMAALGYRLINGDPPADGDV